MLQKGESASYPTRPDRVSLAIVDLTRKYTATRSSTGHPLTAKIPADLSDWPRDIVEGRPQANGDFPRWQAAIRQLPAMRVETVRYGDTIEIAGQVDNVPLRAALQTLHPWRKGPFRIGTTLIDTEWRSDLKWARLAGAIAPLLTGARVLDIGCGNGYFGWRMLDAGAQEVVGVDPMVLYCMQHQAMQRYIDDTRNVVLPLGVDEVPATSQFDAVFSMGVLYHRRDPAAHFEKLSALTKPGGFTVLETLIHEGTENLIPAQRYCRMRNVWCVPTRASLEHWMLKAGFRQVQLVDVTATTTLEQRSTEWMRFESLAESLDPAYPAKTIEGYPSPVRAILLGHK